MPQTATPDSGGFLLQLLTESFAFRALLGSLAAAGLTSLAVYGHLVHSTRARRLFVLAPVLVAAAAGIVTARQATAVYLPQLFVASASSGAAEQVLDLIDELRWISLDRELNLLVAAWATIAAILLARRLVGILTVRSVLSPGMAPAEDHRRLVMLVDSLAPRMGLRSPRLLLVERCPGGAFASGTLRPLIAVDPEFVRTLDDRELEGLLAHELAHLHRRDPLLCLLVGLFRDLTFFLPPAYLAGRWLWREQEESADQVAAEVTARPASLASSILKVWDRATLAGPPVACAAVPADVLWRSGSRGSAPGAHALSRAARMVSRRVERLVSGDYLVTSLRRRIEIAMAISMLVAASGTAVAVPNWIGDQYARILIGSLPALPDTPVESEAFATYRYLTRDSAAAGEVQAARAGNADASAACPCVESQTQLRMRMPATAPKIEPGLRWSGTSQPFDLRDPRLDDVPSARSLWTLNERQPRLGVFLVDGSG
ncbi:MAG: M48 family metalloprotease [Nitriliruptorales bacterium]|nr:M48 family metalloprotease [Nitriliruptorales bacterium]